MRYLVPVLLALVFAAPAAEAGERAGQKIRRGKQPQGLYGVYPSRSVKPNEPKGFGYHFAPRGLKVPVTGRTKQGKQPTRVMPDFLVRAIGLFNGEMKTIAKELGKRRIGASDKVRKLLGRDLIPADDAIRATAETLIRYDAI